MTIDASTDRPFVGRTAERQTLAAHIAAARDGNGRVVLISGEPGVGKTRLVEEAIAASAPERVLWGRCHETEGAPAFWPWIQALRTYARGVPADRLRRQLGDDAAELARLVPAIRTQLPDVAETTPDSPVDPEAARFRLFDAVTMLLRSIATDDTLLVVLDDLHWADNESLLLLAFVARELRDARLLVVGTYRDAELRQAAAAARALGTLARTCHRVTLGGLAVDDIAGYVRATYHLAPTLETLEAVHAATAGNAFFVTEVLQLLHGKGQLEAATPQTVRLDIPDGAREVIRRRVQPLSDDGRRTLAAAAVIGRDFEIGVLVRMGDLPPVEVMLRDLADAVQLGVIEELVERPGAFRFTHALVQDALVDELGPDARARLHQAAGAALEAVFGDALDPILGDIAHHYLEAVPLGTLPKAIQFTTLAGQHAYGQLGYDEAAGHFERALQASRGSAMSPGERLSLLLPLGHAQQAAGDDEGARATFIEAAQLARDIGDAYTFPHAALSAAAGAETGTIDRPLIRILEEALNLVGVRSGRRRAMLHAQLARSLYFADVTRRHAHSEEAVRIATGIDDDVARLAALRARQLALWEPGQCAARRAIGAEILDLATGTRDAMAMADALGWRVLDHLELGEMSVVNDALRRYRELAASCRLPRVRWHVTVVEAALAALAGRFRDAERLAQRAVGLLPPNRHNNVAAFFGVQLFLIYEEEARLAELEAVVSIAAERAVNLPIWRAGMVLLHATLGRRETAQRALSELGGARFEDLPRDGNLLGTYARLAEACALLDAPAFAEPLLPLLEPHTGAVVVLATTAGALGSTARYAGLLAHVLGRHDVAVAHFEQALATNERIGALPQLAHTQRELARTLRLRGAPRDRERAAALETEAAATAARLGLVALQQRLASGAEPARPTAAPTAVPSRRAARLLREGDVWTIVCGDEITRIKDTKGVAHLVELLRHPGREFHALDLGGAGDLRTGDSGEMLDADARRAYKARLNELRDELEEAESFHDVGRTARLREEMDMLADELSRASGLGARSRKAGSDAERARLNVTRAMRKVVRKIEADCPVLGHHLDRAVQTGLFCCYEPDPAFAIDWEL
jgi:tetratricopeptide (TPR) repeat protein